MMNGMISESSPSDKDLFWHLLVQKDSSMDLRFCNMGKEGERWRTAA